MQANHLYFKLLRESLGLSQRQCADYLGVNSRTLERWEAGVQTLAQDKLDQLYELEDSLIEAVEDQAECIQAFYEKHNLGELKNPIVLLIYKNDADYNAVHWPPERKWPTAAMHRLMTYFILQRLENEADIPLPRLAEFDRQVYFEWLTGRKDNTGARAEWAAHKFKTKLD